MQVFVSPDTKLNELSDEPGMMAVEPTLRPQITKVTHRRMDIVHDKTTSLACFV